MSPIALAFVKFAGPAIAAAVLFRRFGSSDLLAGSLKPPEPRQAALWASLYLGWMLVTDVAIGWRGPWDLAPWKAALAAASVLRILAVVIAGPILEELVFRGLAFGVLARRVGPIAAVVATSVVWSLLHWSYEPAVIAIIMIAGVILGLARWRSGSLSLPIALHMMWNAYAVW